MFTTTDTEIEALADAVGVLRKFAPSYQGEIYPCSQCGTPCTGVMCLSCATK